MADNAIDHGEVGKESHDLHPAAAEDLGWSPDGRSFLVTGEDCQQQSGIYRIDVKTGEAVLIVKIDQSDSIIAVAWAPDRHSIDYTNWPRLQKQALIHRHLLIQTH